jgi:hypothetical protein
VDKAQGEEGASESDVKLMALKWAEFVDRKDKE